eukprot:scaffold7375_cov268-Pinguiococcus_pyrenoidosus.AAC.25
MNQIVRSSTSSVSMTGPSHSDGRGLRVARHRNCSPTCETSSKASWKYELRSVAKSTSSAPSSFAEEAEGLRNLALRKSKALAKSVQGQQLVSVLGHPSDRVQHEVDGLRILDERQVDARESRLDDGRSRQSRTVRTGTGAAAARLNAEKVVQKRAHKILVEQLVLHRHQEGERRKPARAGVADDVQIWAALTREALVGSRQVAFLDVHDRVFSNLSLQLEDGPRADGAEDLWCAALFSHFQLVFVGVHRVGREAHGPPRGAVRRLCRRLRKLWDAPPHDQDAGRPGASKELVWREEHGVDAAVFDVDRQVRPSRGIVEARQRILLVQQSRDRLDVRDRAVHVGSCAERADDQRSILELVEQLCKVLEVDAALPLRIQVAGDDVGIALPPGQQIRMVLVRTHDNHRPLRRICRSLQVRQQLEWLGQQAHQEVDGPRGAGTHEDDCVRVLGDAARRCNLLAGLLPKHVGPAAGERSLRVRIGVGRQNLMLHEGLDAAHGPARGSEVAVHQTPDAEGSGHTHVGPDHVGS